MCKILSSEVVIGNFILDSLNQGKINIDLKDLIDFDSKLSTLLIAKNYFTHFNINSVFDFQINYPFLIDAIQENSLCLKSIDNNIEQIKILLTRYFRMGLPNTVILDMKKAYEEVLS